MNLYFRLLRILVKCLFAKRVAVLEGSRIRYRAWPFDCDINLHLTNARYFALCDLARTYYLGQVGVLGKMVRRNWLPVVQSQVISYIKPINPLQRFEVTTELSHWDEKYWYVVHKFFVGDKLCAVLQVRGVIINGRKVIPMSDVVALTGEDVASPPRTGSIEHWQDLLESKKSL